MILTAIIATDLRGGIGYKGGLPWPILKTSSGPRF